MIVTKSWLNEFVDLESVSLDKIVKTLNSIGLEVDSVDKIEVPNGIVVGKVLSVEKHPDADKLNICQVDLGTTQKQIVCGAKNVAQNQFVPVATVGADLGNGFIIKDAKLRGVDSFGMICSSSEIGLAKIEDGIMVLDDTIGELELGKALNEYEIFNDHIIEIELTANRGDCLSIYGVARELATALDKKLKNLTQIEEDDHSLGMGRVFQIEHSNQLNSSLIYKVAKIENLEFLNKSAKKNIRLTTIGIELKDYISNLVAYTTHTTGVIFNIFDENSLEYIEKNGKRKLSIKSSDIGIDEVYGVDKLCSVGLTSNIPLEIRDDMKLIIQASYVDPTYISKKVFENSIKTQDIYYKTSRGSEPNLSMGINYISNIMQNIGLSIYGGSTDLVKKVEPIALRVDIDYINQVIGQSVTKLEVVRVLKSLGFNVNSNSEELVVEVPNFRHDINNIHDVIEEIVRIIGIDNIKSTPLNFAEQNRENIYLNNFKNRKLIRTKAVANGFYEAVNYVFSSKELLSKYNFETISEDLDLTNPISSELNTLRTTHLIGLLNNIVLNKNSGQKSIALFEIGSIFNKNREEREIITFIHSGLESSASLENSGKPNKIEFFKFCSKISSIIGEFELEKLQKDDISDDSIHPYQNAKIIINGQTIGYISKLHPKVQNDFNIDDTIYAQIDFSKIPFNLKFASNISKFPATYRDLSLLIPSNSSYLPIKKEISKLNISEIINFYPIDLYSDESLGNMNSLSIRFDIQSNDKTMRDEDINEIMDRVLDSLKNSLNIELR
jgi:phenylalanyl-tRNA synthetase beta chain